ncbi:MAG: Asp-tRNA(Asn)/Glu-tRNA(Gln) amidotransferase subunit GatC [Microthrixaceae bacterium]
MSPRISRDDVVRVARLARLDLDDADLDRSARQLGDILDHAADMSLLDLDGVEPTAHPYPLVNVMRDDVVAPSLDRAEVLAAAPQTEADMFRVPPVKAEEP